MLKQGGQSKRSLEHPLQGMLLFSVGGRRLAVKMEEVVGVTSWKASIPVAGETPFVSGLMRHDQVVLPVFDLAGRLQVSVEGGHPLCLVTKHPLGNMAICIDEAMPMMLTCDSARLQVYQGNELPAERSYVVDTEEVPILVMSRLLASS